MLYINVPCTLSPKGYLAEFLGCSGKYCGNHFEKAWVLNGSIVRRIGTRLQHIGSFKAELANDRFPVTAMLSSIFKRYGRPFRFRWQTVSIEFHVTEVDVWYA